MKVSMEQKIVGHEIVAGEILIEELVLHEEDNGNLILRIDGPTAVLLASSLMDAAVRLFKLQHAITNRDTE